MLWLERYCTNNSPFLGPVLDAVATLLRGPIRSAIANRRSEYLQQRSTEVKIWYFVFKIVLTYCEKNMF
jgi:hypothetical protein